MEKIRQFLSPFNISFSIEQGKLFEKYVLLLQKANEHISLTTIVDTAEIIEKHFIDSLSILKIIEPEVLCRPIKMIDIGAGAGFPGVPLKIIFPNLTLVLVDSVKKKVNFLDGLIKELGLSNAICVAERAENLGQDPRYREQFDIAVARAVSSINVLAEYLLPLNRINGCSVIYKGKDIDAELQEALKAIELLGGGEINAKKFQIGENDRSLVLINKIRSTPKAYPRETGVPKKKPL